MKLKLSETLILGAVPFAAYALCYQYETGYLEYFGVPPDFVSIDYPSILRVSGGVLFFGMMMLNLLSTVSVALRARHPRMRQIMLPLVLGLSIAILVPYLVPHPYAQTVATYAMVLALCAILLLLVFSRGRNPVPNQTQDTSETADEALFHPVAPGIVGRIETAISPLFMVAFLVAALFVNFAGIAGRAAGSAQRSFMVVGAEPQAVIRTYGNRAILARLNISSRTIDKSFTVVSLESLDGKAIHYGNVGPLVPVDTAVLPATQLAGQVSGRAIGAPAQMTSAPSPTPSTTDATTVP